MKELNLTSIEVIPINPILFAKSLYSSVTHLLNDILFAIPTNPIYLKKSQPYLPFYFIQKVELPVL